MKKPDTEWEEQFKREWTAAAGKLRGKTTNTPETAQDAPESDGEELVGQRTRHIIKAPYSRNSGAGRGSGAGMHQGIRPLPRGSTGGYAVRIPLPSRSP